MTVLQPQNLEKKENHHKSSPYCMLICYMISYSTILNILLYHIYYTIFYYTISTILYSTTPYVLYYILLCHIYYTVFYYTMFQLLGVYCSCYSKLAGSRSACERDEARAEEGPGPVADGFQAGLLRITMMDSTYVCIYTHAHAYTHRYIYIYAYIYIHMYFL